MMLLGKTFVSAVAIAGLAPGVAADFEVTSPSKGMSVIAERTYTVKWTGFYAKSRVAIDLYTCGSECGEDECGSWVTSLCPYGDIGCPDNMGDYDIKMPAPMAGTGSSPVYKVLVKDVADESNASCSGAFSLLATVDDTAEGYTGASMIVTSPSTGDMAYAGDSYTVLFDYVNEVGDKEGRFNIDLYESEGGGDCGTYVTTICDKPEIGCKDTAGDYDVVLPTEVPEGLYKIRISPFEDPGTYGCSGEFLIVSDYELEGVEYSYSFRA